jgi:hypothetical protein
VTNGGNPPFLPTWFWHTFEPLLHGLQVVTHPDAAHAEGRDLRAPPWTVHFTTSSSDGIPASPTTTVLTLREPQRDHPTVPYAPHAEGARLGTPQACQVADRFHLAQNFRAAVEQQLCRLERPGPSGRRQGRPQAWPKRAERGYRGEGANSETPKIVVAIFTARTIAQEA